MHLRALKQYFRPVKLQDWITARSNGSPLPDRAVAIAFDDGWRDNHTYAFEHLQAEQIPATIFLVSDYVGTEQTFWPERLMNTIIETSRRFDAAIWKTDSFAWLYEMAPQYDFINTAPSRDALDDIVNLAKRYQDSDLHVRIDAMQESIGMTSSAQPDILDWDQVHEMTKSDLIDFGSHTRQHVRMSPALEGDRLEDQIVGSKKVIEDKTGRPVSLFCYPNGDITPQAEALVRQHYDGACTTAYGWNLGQTDVYRIKRVGIHQDVAYDRTAFLARISGWM